MLVLITSLVEDVITNAVGTVLLVCGVYVQFPDEFC